MLSPEHVALVQQSFDRAARIAPHLAATFYAELFAIDPALRRLFPGDMIRQGEKLLNMLAYIVANLANAEALLPAARELAIRHVSYGVEASHYTAVGTALLRTLKHELGADLTREAREAWTITYGRLADVMIEAAYPQRLAANAR